jgi:signal transduction histidine kinase
MMFKSIFQRLLITYLLLALIIISGLTFFVSAGYSSYFLSERREMLRQIADEAKALSVSYHDGTIDQQTLNTCIDSLGGSSDSLIYILQLNQSDAVLNEKIQISGFKDKTITKDIIAVLNGKEIIRNKQYSEAFSMDVMLIGLPVKYSEAEHGAVILMHPLDNIKDALWNIQIKIWVAAFITFLLSIPLIYFTASRISNPVKRIDQNVRDLREGIAFDAVIFDSKDEIGRLSRSFHDMKSELEKTEMIRREMIANISHELRTPLTSINGFVQGMLDGIVPENKQRDYLGIIKEESGRLIGLTSEIIDLAKLRSGNIRLNLVEINIREEIVKTIAGINLSDQGRSILINILADENIIAVADKDRFKQILINIITNSVKYSRGDVTIDIMTEVSASYVKIRIQDNGPGVAEDELPLLFDKFYRTDSMTNREGGAGIGLSVVKELVTQLGGAPEAFLSPDGGLEIAFTLPLAHKL